MNKKTRLKLTVSLFITLSLAVAIFFAVSSKPYEILELKALDLRFTLQGAQPARGPVVHVDIDDQSLAKIGRWPWPRSYHARLTRILKECGARQILWDVIFTEADKENPQEDEAFADAIDRSGITYLPFYFDEPQSFPFPKLKEILLKDISISVEKAAQSLGVDAGLLRDKLPAAKRMVLDEAVRDIIRKDPEISFDACLERLERERGFFLFAEDESYVQERFVHHQAVYFYVNRFSVDIPGSWPFFREAGSLNVPIMAYARRMMGSGFINADPDIDGVTRKVPLFVRYEGKILPQLTIAALLDRLEVKNVEVGPNRVTLKKARFHPGRKDIVIPVDSQGCMIVNWHGKWDKTFKHIPYYLILQLEEVRSQLAGRDAGISGAEEVLRKMEADLTARLKALVNGKICIVGLTATGTHDLRPIPLQENYPMVGTHSNFINTILTERFIVRQRMALRVLMLVVTALVIALVSLLKLWKSLVLAIVYAAGFFWVCFYLFISNGLWLDMVGPLGIVVFGLMAITSFRFFTEEREKLWIKGAFSHYLSHEVISEMMDNPSRLTLGGERRHLTVLFSDVRGFTAFSETRQPEEVVAMLNEVLSLQVKVIFHYNGTLDKFVGDEVMAFFGAPSKRHEKDHALVAIRVALDIQEKMKELRQNLAQDAKAAIQIGIGINTGDMVVGNMGSAERMDYTVIGDNVNLGARLCAAAGKGEIIISESTFEMARDHVVVEKLEPIMVKGKTNPISIYRVTGLK
ncbi:MAG TPA: adenylate/guanylate cyclase domain-containing protein [Candidatus Omnitrophota bacterium]|nr:adenylate/guanylate cyclase domain-containing protein [Candidatus Omnitrophota bacterium]